MASKQTERKKSDTRLIEWGTTPCRSLVSFRGIIYVSDALRRTSPSSGFLFTLTLMLSIGAGASPRAIRVRSLFAYREGSPPTSK